MRGENNEISKDKNEIPQIPSGAIKDKREKVISDFLKIIKFLIDSPKLKRLIDQNEFSQLIDYARQSPDFLESFILNKISLRINSLIETSYPEDEEGKQKEERIIREYLKNYCLIPRPESMRLVLDYISNNYPTTFIESYSSINSSCSNSKISGEQKIHEINPYLLNSFEILIKEKNIKPILENIETFYSVCKKNDEINSQDINRKGSKIFMKFLSTLETFSQEKTAEIIQTLDPEKFKFLYKNIFGRFITETSFNFLIEINKTRVNEEESIQKEDSISIWEKILLGLELLKDYESNIRSIEDKDGSRKGLPPKLAQILIYRNNRLVSTLNNNEFFNSNYSENLWKNTIAEFSKEAGVELTILEVMAYIMFEVNKIIDEASISHLWGLGARRTMDEQRRVSLKQYLDSPRFLTSLDIYGINNDRARLILKIAHDYFGSNTVLDEKGNIISFSPDDQIIYGFLNNEDESYHNKQTQDIYGDKKFVFDKNKIINRTTFTLYDSSALDTQTRFIHSLKYPGVSILEDIFTLSGRFRDSRMLDLDYLRETIFKDKVEDTTKHTYSEVQIHYGASMRDVKAIYTGEYGQNNRYIEQIKLFNEANGTNITIHHLDPKLLQDS